MWKSKPLNEGISARGILYIPLRDYKKLGVKEDIAKLTKEGNTNVRYTLHAKFSWLKTLDEVNQFEKNYKVVDEKIVSDLVKGFKRKFNTSLTQK